MTLDYKLDRVDWHILQLLQENGRFTYAEIGRAVGLSAPAVAERIHRLEEADLIEGYHAQINPAKVGLHVLAFVRVSVPRALTGIGGFTLAVRYQALERWCVTLQAPASVPSSKWSMKYASLSWVL